MAYIGSTPETQSFTSGTDYFNGNGSSTAFTLSRPVASVNDIEVVISNVVQQPSTAYNVSGTTITFTSAPPSGTANVYVRYLSTITQTITPSPGTVDTAQLSPSLTNVPFFGGSTIGAGNATGMKNRIINGGMVIDQRNAGASVDANGAFPVDRFPLFNGGVASKFTAQRSTTIPAGFSNSVVLTSTSTYSISSSDRFGIRHAIEGFNVADLGWGTANAKTITISFWVRSSLTGTFGGSITNGGGNRSYPFTYTISSANAWEQKSVTVAGDTSGTWATDNTAGIQLYFGIGVGSTFSGAAGTWASANYFSATGATSVVGTNGATFYITGVQLEEGNAATSFEFRPYGTELALCQRYYAKLSGGGFSNFAPFAVGFCGNSTSIEGVINYPVTMRAAATLSFSNVRTNTATGTNAAITSVSNSYAGTNSMNAVFVSSGSSLTQGQGGTIIGNTNSSAYIDLSAEL